jgi:hypothetical protein
MNRLVSLLLICLFAFLITLSEPEAAGLFDTAKKEAETALANNDYTKLKEAIKILNTCNDLESFSFLWSEAQNTADNNIETYWIFLKGVASFTDEKVLEKLTEILLLNKQSAIGRDTMFMFKDNCSIKVLPVLNDILTKGTEELQVMAIEHLANIPSKNSIEILINGLKPLTSSKTEGLREKIRLGLLELIGQDQGGTSPEKWAAWWESVKDKPEKNILKRTDDMSSTGTIVDRLDTERKTDYARMAQLSKSQIIVVDGECGNEQCQKIHGGNSHAYDHIEKVLERMEIPHTVVHRCDFDKNSYKLNFPKANIKDPRYASKNDDGQVAVIINCALWREFCINPEHHAGGKSDQPRLLQCAGPGYHIPHSAKLSDSTIKKIKTFVEQGGYLFTEDMGLEEVLERAFNGLFKHTTYLPEQEVTIFPAPGMNTHPYLKGVFEILAAPRNSSDDNKTTIMKKEIRVGEGKWKIDNESPDLIINKPESLDILIISPQLLNKPANQHNQTSGYGNNQPSGGPLAIAFAYSLEGARKIPLSQTTGGNGYGTSAYAKGGRVMHVMSHFGKQKLEEDEFILQNLLLNFLMEANQRRFQK